MVVRFETFCDRLLAVALYRWVPYAAILLALTWKILSGGSVADPDLFARLGMGRLIQANGYVPLEDPFAFTEKLPVWIDHEWLSGVVFLWLVELWGDYGLLVFKLLCAALTALFVTAASRINNNQVAGLHLWIVVCLLDASYLWGTTVRCQSFTYLFISYLLFAVVAYQKKGTTRYLFLVPILAIPWINLHGGWALGMLSLWLITLVSATTKRPYKAILAAAATGSIAPLCTPYGPVAFVTYLTEALQLERPSIEEWWPLVTDVDAFIITTSLALTIIAGGFLRRRLEDLVGPALLIFSAYCGYQHIRFVGFFMLCAAVYGPTYSSAMVRFISERYPRLAMKFRRAFTCAFAVLLLYIAVDTARIVSIPNKLRLTFKSLAIEPLTWLARSAESGRLLVDFNNGSLALWTLYPHFLISVDGRYEEVYPESTVQSTATALRFNTPEGRAALNRLDPTHILVSAKMTGDIPQPPPGWSVIYNDSGYVILKKDSSVTTATTARTKVSLWAPFF